MKKYLLVSLLIIYFVSLFPSDALQAENNDDKAWLVSKFNDLDFAINNGEGYTLPGYTNEDGILAWAESYLLEAYLDMYEATKVRKYLEKFIIQADYVSNNSDKSRGIVDYKGRTRTGWSSTKYSKNKEPMVHLVHTGMILCPMVKFSLLVKNQEDLSGYTDIAKKYTKLAEDAVLEAEGQWRFDPETAEGSYWFEGDEPIGADLTAPMPFNGQLAFGRVIILLYQITGNELYFSKAEGLALHFKNNLLETVKGSYIWGYRPYLKKYPLLEDISHGAIDVDFAVKAFKMGIVFKTDDLKKFVRTIAGAKKDGKFSMFVDGTDDEKKKADYSDASSVWLDLCVADCDIFKLTHGYISNRVKVGRTGPQMMVGLAKLLKYYDVCYGK